MDIKQATIEWIGEIQNDEKLALDISTSSTPKTRYIIFKNKNSVFDLIKKFKRKDFKVGDKIDFDYNQSGSNSFPSIWRITNHKRKR